MEIFGIGLPELILIFAIMLIVLGPKDMVATGRKMGKYIRKIIQSPTWRAVMDTSQELRNLPTKIIREAGLEEDLAELNRKTKSLVDEVKTDLNTLEDSEKIPSPLGKNGKQPEATAAEDGQTPSAASTDEEKPGD